MSAAFDHSVQQIVDEHERVVDELATSEHARQELLDEVLELKKTQQPQPLLSDTRAWPEAP